MQRARYPGLVSLGAQTVAVFILAASCFALRPNAASSQAAAGSALATPSILSAAEQSFATSSRPLFEQFCFDCHGNRKTKARINFEALLGAPDFDRHFKIWERAGEMLEQREMPPEDAPQPSDTERLKLIGAIRGALKSHVRSRAGDPGRVVIRRLTSAEYEYTLRDLTGLRLDLQGMLADEAAGGEGFANVGDVQFIQESTLERYLEAAKLVASHAVIGAGPLRFYRDPGRTGQELSAIQRIQTIYRQHGFRTGAGEGAEAFGLEMYPKAFHAAWRFKNRRALGIPRAELTAVAHEEQLEPKFVEHVWRVLTAPNPAFPVSEIAGAWRLLPPPDRGREAGSQIIRDRCVELHQQLRGWHQALAATTANDEEVPVLSESSFRPLRRYAFRAAIGWPKGASNATVKFHVSPIAAKAGENPIVAWRNPVLRLRQGLQRPPRANPLQAMVEPGVAERIRFGHGPEGVELGSGDFVTQGEASLELSLKIPAGAIQAELQVDAQLEFGPGEDPAVRCTISAPIPEGATAAASGVVSALLMNPEGGKTTLLRTGASELARLLPQVSHREPAPSDRDPIPAPYDSTYNNPERNGFHSSIKYHRDDAFLAAHMLNDATRAELDQAWFDLLSSFDYHDTFLRFVAAKLRLPLGATPSMVQLTTEQLRQLNSEARKSLTWLHADFTACHLALREAEPRHLADLLDFAQLAWRRPLNDSERHDLQDFYGSLREKAKLDHSQAVRTSLARVLAAPAFLYRIEAPAESKATSALTDWELASRLSYFLWSSPPDAELRKAAAAGLLRRPEELSRQARRMIRDPKARRFAAEFFGQWFGFYRFDHYRGIDTRRFPEFNDKLKSALHDEAISFFEHIVRAQRPVGEILSADYAYLNRTLAEHYGLKLESNLPDDITRLDGANRFHRGGLLRLGAVLAVTSAPLRTSAVKRGDWMLRRVLGTPVPPPPGDVGSIAPDDVSGDGRTVRAQLEAHRRDASCVNCHSRIDPLGFALEHFDPLGRWRDTYRDGQPIETRGTLNDGTTLSSLEDLDRYLSAKEGQFQRTLCAKLLGYALGRSELPSDSALIEQMIAGLKKDPSLCGLAERIVASTQFRFQRPRDPGANLAITQPR